MLDLDLDTSTLEGRDIALKLASYNSTRYWNYCDTTHDLMSTSYAMITRTNDSIYRLCDCYTD